MAMHCTAWQQRAILQWHGETEISYCTCRWKVLPLAYVIGPWIKQQLTQCNDIKTSIRITRKAQIKLCRQWSFLETDNGSAAFVSQINTNEMYAWCLIGFNWKSILIGIN